MMRNRELAPRHRGFAGGRPILWAVALFGCSAMIAPRCARAEPPAKETPSATAAQPAADKAAPPSCPPISNVAGYSDCQAVEITGSPPCEAICKRPRQLAKADRCCADPVEVAVLSGARVLLRVEACGFVSPECANVHGHGRMDAQLRVLPGSPPEVIVVEGGCESRALMHGYVPRGVAAWSGCVHTRYRWNGKQLLKQ